MIRCAPYTWIYLFGCFRAKLTGYFDSFLGGKVTLWLISAIYLKGHSMKQEISITKIQVCK